MANKIQIKRGNKANLPVLSDGELAYCKDAGQLFVGNGGMNQQIGSLMQSGTWTPNLSSMTGNVGFNTTPNGSYIKIGSLVLAYFDISIYTNETPGGTFQVGGLPFAASKEAAAALSSFSGGISMTGMPIAVIAAGSSSIRFKYANFGGSRTKYADVIPSMLFNSDGGSDMKCTIAYNAA